MLAEQAFVALLLQQCDGFLDRQLVRRDVVGNARPRRVAAAVSTFLHVGAVAADAHDERFAVVGRTDRDRVDLTRVDLTEPVVHEVAQTLTVGNRRTVGAAGTEVEVGQPLHPVALPGGDAVEVVLHLRGEAVVDQPGEVLLEQADNREGGERRHQRSSALEDVAAVLDRAEDRRIGRRPSDAQLFQRLDEARLGVASGRVRRVRLRLDAGGLDRLSLLHRWQPALAVVALGLLVVGFLDVRTQEAGERDDLAARAELGDLFGGAGAHDPHADGVSRRVAHLRGDRALPDQLIETELVAAQLAAHLTRRAETIAGGADRLVRLLRVLHLALVTTRRIRDVLGAVQLAGLLTCCSQRGLRQRRRVRPHVGDVAVLVQPLGETHGDLRREPQLAAAFLLQRAGDERCVRRPAVGPLLDAADREAAVAQPAGERTGGVTVQVDDI